MKLNEWVTDFLKRFFSGKVPFMISWSWTFKAPLPPARCPKCQSKWVCWNWIHSWGNETTDEVRTWYHECHDCDTCFETPNKITNGVPHWLLMLYGGWRNK